MCSVKKVFLKNSQNSQENTCTRISFNKVAGLRPANVLQRLFRRCFPINFVKFFRTPFLKKHLWWLLLKRCLHYRDRSTSLELYWNRTHHKQFSFYKSFSAELLWTSASTPTSTSRWDINHTVTVLHKDFVLPAKAFSSQLAWKCKVGIHLLAAEAS